VIDGKIINGTLTIKAANVTIENSVIENYGYWGVDASAEVAAGNVTIKNNTFTAASGVPTDAAIAASGTIIGNNISGSEKGINLTDGPSVVKDNYIHDINSIDPAAHLDGIFLGEANAGHVQIEHNTIQAWDTSDIIIKNDFGSINDVTVTNNLLLGDQGQTVKGGPWYDPSGRPAYAVYVYGSGNAAGTTTTNVSVTNNYIEKGLYGYIATDKASPTISGNIEWDNTKDSTPYPSSLPSSPSSPSSPTQPSAPMIASFSNDTGKVGDGITSDNTLELKGTGAANSTVTVYDNGKQIGTTKADASGSWDYITGVLTDAKHALTATVTTAAGTSAASAATNVTVDTVAATPVVIGNSVVNTNHVQMSGTAEAGSTVNIYDGNTVVGTGTASTSGAWSITTGVLSSGTHALKATATDVAGNVSALSQASNATIPTGTVTTPPPAAPNIVSFSNDTGKDGNDHITNDNTLTLQGTAAANSTVKIYDGTNTKPIATVTANGSGQWTVTTPTLGDGTHSLTATSTSSSQTSSASAALSVVVDTIAPGAPVITSDSIVNTNQVKASGTAAANSTITVYDDNAVVGSGTADASGNWTVTTSALPAGNHPLIATATDAAGNVSAQSQPFDPVVGGGSTTQPTTPSELSGVVRVGNHYFLGSSTGPELKYGGSVVSTGQFQDWVPISSVKLDNGGYDVAWKNSSGQFTFWTTDSQGNFKSYPTHGVALASNSATVESYENIFHQDLNGDHTIGVPGTTSTPTNPGTPTTPTSGVNFTSLTENPSSIVTIKGTADAFSQVKMYDGKAYMGTTTAGADGTWSFTSSSAVSNTVHTFSAVEVDSAGHTTANSGSAILGSRGSNTLTSTSGNDILAGNGHPDTFVFAPNFGKDVIQDFHAGWRGSDTIQFSKSEFDSFASVLSHASQVGQDVVISAGSDTLTLKNVKLGGLNSHDFHFA
jgi:hypothetical protein